MASTKGTGRNALPKRFRPLYDQALTQADLRYGGQESLLASLLGQTDRDYGQQAQAQTTAGQSVLGAYSGASAGLTKAYSDAGLTPGLLSQIGGSPTGQRLAGELASNQADIQQGLLGVQAGQQYLQQHIADQRTQDIGKIGDSLDSLNRERGVFTADALGQLIGSDRETRAAANTAARQQQYDQQQSLLAQEASQTNALIGQGLLPDENGKLQPLPGGKADPASRKPKTGSLKPASQATIKDATGTYSQIQSLAKALWDQGISRQAAGQALLKGRKGAQGEKVYDPATGKPVLNPDGTQKTTTGKSEVPSFASDQPLLQAVLDQTYDGHVSPATIKRLHKAYGDGIVGALGLTTNRRKPKPARPEPTPMGVFGGLNRPTIG